MFKVFTSNDLEILEKDMELYTYHITMKLNLPDAYNSLENFEVESPKIKARVSLESELLNSNECFLKKAKEILKPWEAEIQERKKQFRELVISANTVNLEQFFDNPSLFLTLYSLCCVKAEKSLLMIAKKNGDLIKHLTNKEFNSICVAAAFNHLPKFINFLCNEGRKLGRNIDDYSVEPYSDHSVWICCVTPFIAAVLGVCDNPYNWTKEKIEKAIEVVNILLANQANPQKKYIVDEVSEDHVRELLNKESSYTIFQTVIGNTLSSSDKHSSNQFNKENIEAYGSFIKHIRQCSSTLSSINDIMASTSTPDPDPDSKGVMLHRC